MLGVAKKATLRMLRMLGYELVGVRDYAMMLRKIRALSEHVALLQQEADQAKSRLEVVERDATLLARSTDEPHPGTRLIETGQQESPAMDSKPDAVGPDSRFWPPRYPFPKLSRVDLTQFRLGIVDVGAEPLEFEEDVYAPLLREANCDVVGFDPFNERGERSIITQADADRKITQKVILPYFVGDGQRAMFHLNQYAPTSSLFPTNVPFATQFQNLAEVCRTRKTWEVDTRRLDDIEEIGTCDFLKVDVQGADYDVVANGSRVLEKTLFLHIEVEFAPLYKGQRLFSDINSLMESHGFELIDLVKMGWNNYRAMPSALLRSRLLWADAIYMKRTDKIAEIDDQALLRAAFIAHVNYRKYDLAAHLIQAFDSAAGTNLVRDYLDSFNSPQ